MAMTDEQILRLEAIQLASRDLGPVSSNNKAVIKRATAYLNFLQGKEGVEDEGEQAEQK